LRSARQAFKKFGPYLTDPETDLKIIVPNSLPTIHKYNVKDTLALPEKILDQS